MRDVDNYFKGKLAEAYRNGYEQCKKDMANGHGEFIDFEIPSIFKDNIKTLDLSQRAYDCLRRSNIHNVGALVMHHESEILRLPYLGRKTLYEIKEKLNERGLDLGMFYNMGVN